MRHPRLTSLNVLTAALLLGAPAVGAQQFVGSVLQPDDQGRRALCDIPVRRDVALRWDARGKERTIAFTVPRHGRWSR